MESSVHHPASLRVFFATEMWERYGFYVVQSLLALYLAYRYHWQDNNIYALVGSFTALTYLSPVVGGWIADHLIGQKRSVLTGVVVLFCSYLVLTLFSSKIMMLAALAGIAVGTGLLKPNISSLLGNQYVADSSGRESGFTIFYMGITLGIILGTTLPSKLIHYGWPVSFASAAFGMILAFGTFAYGIKRHKIIDYYPFDYQFSKLIKAALIMAVLWSLSFSILMYPSLANLAFLFIVILSIFYLVVTLRNESTSQARQTIVIGLLCIISILFWAFYFQMFMSLTLFIDRVVEPKLWGIEFPPPYYVGIQSIGMLIIGYFLSRKKQQLSSEQRGKQTGSKFMIAMILTCLAYGIIVFVCVSNPDQNRLSPLYFIPTYLLLSGAELYLSPVGLAAITILASRKKVSTMMGIFFVSLGIGAFLSGKLAEITAIKSESISIIALKSHYTSGFITLTIILISGTIICALLNWLIKQLMTKQHA